MRSLFFILNMKYTELKTEILEGKLKPEKIVTMTSTDFLSEDKRQQLEKELQKKMEAQRSDWLLEK